jgi:AraC-like DNA-binding protein
MLPVQTYYPQNFLLRKYISYYYFLETNSPQFNSTYYAFPNILNSLNIYKHAKSVIDGHTVVTQNHPNNKYLLTVQGRYDQPLFVQLRGILNKITIVFKPLGLNCFIRKPFSDVANKPTQFFKEWDCKEKYPLFLDGFFNCPTREQQIQTLESYLLSVYKPIEQENILTYAIDQLSNFEEQIPISEVARDIDINERTFNRLFEKHLGISPIKYRKIARFRHSLTNKISNEKFKRLTEIGYASNFYDQSYFIKVYNKLAGSNPKAFFKSINKMADDNLIFQFISNLK